MRVIVSAPKTDEFNHKVRILIEMSIPPITGKRGSVDGIASKAYIIDGSNQVNFANYFKSRKMSTFEFKITRYIYSPRLIAKL